MEWESFSRLVYIKNKNVKGNALHFIPCIYIYAAGINISVRAPIPYPTYVGMYM